MKAVALLINDMHVSQQTIDAFNKNWQEALDVCHDYSINQIFLGGDVFVSRSSQTLASLMAVKNAIQKANGEGTHIIAYNGNHCKVNQEANIGYCNVFDSLGYSVVDEYMGIEFDNFTLHLLPYYPEAGSLPERIDKIELSPGKKNILYAHIGVNGGLSQESESNKELPAKRLNKFDKVLLGHYHNRAQLPGTDIYYIGASRQFNFGEQEDMGYTVLFEDGSHKFIQNTVNSRYKTINIEYSKLTPDLKEEIGELNDDDYKVRLRISCSKNEKPSINKSEWIQAGAAKVEILCAEEDVVLKAEQSAFHRFDKKGIAQGYQEFCKKKDSADVEFGLKYINLIN